jgi:hypothetical protein
VRWLFKLFSNNRTHTRTHIHTYITLANIRLLCIYKSGMPALFAICAIVIYWAVIIIVRTRVHFQRSFKSLACNRDSHILVTVYFLIVCIRSKQQILKNFISINIPVSNFPVSQKNWSISYVQTEVLQRTLAKLPLNCSLPVTETSQLIYTCCVDGTKTPFTIQNLALRAKAGISIGLNSLSVGSSHIKLYLLAFVTWNHIEAKRKLK